MEALIVKSRAGPFLPLPTGERNAAGDVTQMTRRSDDDPPPSSPQIFFLQIYTIHVNYLFQGENGEFRRKMTSLHPWVCKNYQTVVKICFQFLTVKDDCF